MMSARAQDRFFQKVKVLRQHAWLHARRGLGTAEALWQGAAPLPHSTFLLQNRSMALGHGSDLPARSVCKPNQTHPGRVLVCVAVRGGAWGVGPRRRVLVQLCLLCPAQRTGFILPEDVRSH